MGKFYDILLDQVVPKGRPRFNRATGAVYTDKKTKDFETYVGQVFEAKYGKLLAEGEVKAYIYIGAKNMRQDLDNIAKSILDGLNGVAYLDDSQVTTLIASKAPVDEEHATVVLFIGDK